MPEGTVVTVYTVRYTVRLDKSNELYRPNTIRQAYIFFSYNNKYCKVKFA